jgi:hypothetical protein
MVVCSAGKIRPSREQKRLTFEAMEILILEVLYVSGNDCTDFFQEGVNTGYLGSVSPKKTWNGTLTVWEQ